LKLKGKGKLQTYWLLLKDEASGWSHSVGELSASERLTLGESDENNQLSATPVPQELARAANLKANSADEVANGSEII